jgi:hypothetical protein
MARFKLIIFLSRGFQKTQNRPSASSVLFRPSYRGIKDYPSKRLFTAVIEKGGDEARDRVASQCKNGRMALIPKTVRLCPQQPVVPRFWRIGRS